VVVLATVVLAVVYLGHLKNCYVMYNVMRITGGCPSVFTCLNLALYLCQMLSTVMPLLIIVTVIIDAMLAEVNVITAVCRRRRYIFDRSVLKKRSLQLNGRVLCPLKDATPDCDGCIVQFEPVSREIGAQIYK